jgi:D-alanyl-D-alanine carboxypeptidase
MKSTTVFDKNCPPPYYFWAMRRNKRLFLYSFLFLIILTVIVIYPQSNKSEEPKKSDIVNQKVLDADFSKVNSLSITATVSAQKSTEVSSGVIITEKGDDLLVLINKNIRLPDDYEPADLVSIDNKASTTTKGLKLRSEAAGALKKMAKAAKKDGVNLIVLSAYRSFWNQQATFSMWVGSAGISSAETFSARPGHSQHQLGTTVDVTSESVNLGLAENFDQSKEGSWLTKNAYKFGFVVSYPKGKQNITGYIYEPWHYRYIGAENAQKMIDSGLILEEFLRKFGVV